MAHARHRFIEQQELGPARKRHRDLELAPLTMCHDGRNDVCPMAQPNLREDSLRRLEQRGLTQDRPPKSEAMPGVSLHTHDQILERGELRKYRCNLVRAGKPGKGTAVGRLASDVA